MSRGIWSIDGDRFFTGWNSKIHRALLPEGTLAKSVNKRLNDQRARTRPGMIMPFRQDQLWGSIDPSVWANVKFLGSFLFVNSSGQERLILVPIFVGQQTTQILSYDIQNDALTTVALPPGAVLNSNYQCWFAQGFGSLIMLVVGLQHGSRDQSRSWTNGLYWDGNETTRQFQWFVPLPITTTATIPPSAFAIPVSNRMAYWANYEYTPVFAFNTPVYDHIIVSDPWGTDSVGTPPMPASFFTTDPILQDFTVNTGSTDRIVTIIPYSYDVMVVFMQRSIMQVSNFSIDPTQVTTTILTQAYGCCGARAALQVGTDIIFMVEKRGVFRLSQTLIQQINAPAVPISDGIQPDIDRINWSAAFQIVFAAADNYLFIAAPVDNSIVNNAIFVFNLTTNQWESIDTFNIPNFRIDNILTVHYNGLLRLLAIQNGPPDIVYLMYEGIVDQQTFSPINPRFTPVLDLIETRGYGVGEDLDPSAFRTYHRGSVVMETVLPSVLIQGITEGVAEVKTFRNAVTKVPGRSYIHGVADVAANPAIEKQQDYTVVGNLPSLPFQFDGQDFEQVPIGDVINIDQLIRAPVTNRPYTGAVPQASRERFPIRMTDRWISLRIANSNGTCTVIATSVEATESRRNARSAA